MANSLSCPKAIFNQNIGFLLKFFPFFSNLNYNGTLILKGETNKKAQRNFIGTLYQIISSFLKFGPKETMSDMRPVFYA
jgi:hypothetical protein